MKKSMLFEAVLVLLLIVLAFALYLMVAAGGPSSGQWALSGVIGSPAYDTFGNIFTGNDGTIYTVDGSHIYAIGPDGRIRWNATIPYLLSGRCVDSWTGYSAIADNGTLYVEVQPTDPNIHCGELLAVSSQGKLLWGNGYVTCDGPGEISATIGRLYVWSPGNLTVYNGNGTEAWHVDVQSMRQIYMPAVADDGTVYLLEGPQGENLTAYGPDGRLKWSGDIGQYGLGSLPVNANYHKLLYDDHTVYVPLQGGLLAVNEDGSLKWKEPYNDSGTMVFWDAPFDHEGNVYLQDGSRIFYVDAEGAAHTFTDTFNYAGPYYDVDAEDGIVYTYQTAWATDASSPGYPSHESVEDAMKNGDLSIVQLLGNRTLSMLDTVRVTAYDLKTGDEKWSYRLPLDEHVDTVSQSDYMNLYPDNDAIMNDNAQSPADWYSSRNISYGTKIVSGWSCAELMPVNGIVYVNLWSYNYEVPTFFGQSRYAYAGGLYAIGKNGSLIWSRSTAERITSVEVKNGTVYYGTNNGNMSAARVNTAAGLGMTAAFYLFVRFFLAGAVTRARGRIDSNKNRNRMLRFIGDHPGSGLYEVSRGLGMNVGTARYHLLILGINHRIVSYKADEKFVRYFANAGSYSPEQQLMVSLMRREGMSRLLRLLAEEPGLSNVELSDKLGLQESAASRYMRELLERGIVEREQVVDGTLSYHIKNEYKQQVVFAIDCIKA